jgi:hypothetical protein
VRAPKKRAVILSAVAAIAAVLAQGTAAETAAAPAAGDTTQLAFPSSRMTTLTPTAGARLEAASVWGGPYTASTGETVTLFLSDAYPQDGATPQRWVEFFASLTHGPELADLRAYILPLREVQNICGRQALACYSPSRGELVAPGENTTVEASAEGIVAHEYGHHVGAARNNAPWDAVDYGTKRWASYLQVCARTESGEFYPGDESQTNYRLNPGEGFAEAFRVLNERRLGLAESSWSIVSTVFQPDAKALALLEQDVLQPWTAPTPKLLGNKGNRTYTVATPLDGTLVVRAAAVGKKTRYRVDVTAGGTTSRRTTSAGGSIATRATVCGQRTARIKLTRTSGTGAFTLTVSTP